MAQSGFQRGGAEQFRLDDVNGEVACLRVFVLADKLALDAVVVGVRAGGKEAATVAVPARIVAGGLMAEESFAYCFRREAFADAGRAGEDHAVGQAAAAPGGLDPLDDGRLVFARKLGQSPIYEVLVADMTRSLYDSLVPSNHISGIDARGYLPMNGKGGAKVGYIDGHVDWKAQQVLGQAWPAAAGTGTTRAGRRNFLYLTGETPRYYF